MALQGRPQSSKLLVPIEIAGVGVKRDARPKAFEHLKRATAHLGVAPGQRLDQGGDGHGTLLKQLRCGLLKLVGSQSIKQRPQTGL